MSANVRLFFNNSQHKLEVEGLPATLDVLAFDGEERLSQPCSLLPSDVEITPRISLRDDCAIVLSHKKGKQQ